MENKLIGIFEAIKSKISGTGHLNEGRKTKLVNRLNELIMEYKGLEITNQEHLDVLEEKGEKSLRALKKTVNNESLAELDSYLRYARASVYDFRHDLSGLNYFTRSFLATAILFMALSPQFFGFLLPAVFLLPIFLGLRGVKQRSKTGLLLATSVAPVGLMTGVIWVKYGLYALTNFNQVVTQVATDLNRSIGAAKAIVIVPSVLGGVLIVLAGLTGYFGYKYRKLFI